MAFEIDQSGKVEDTSKVTVVSIANGTLFTLSISAKDKRIVQRKYREAGRPKIYTLQLFSILVFILLKKSKIKPLKSVIIDREYKGQEDLIKSFIIQLSTKQKLDLSPQEIYFSEIGKRSNAHKIAIEGFRKGKIDHKATLKEVLSFVTLLNKK